jgi:integrase
MLGLLVQFAAYTGLRAGELAALRVRRLDLVRGVVEVAESVAEVPGGFEFGATKNYQRRSVPIPAFLVPALVDLVAGRHAEDLVFTSPTGKVLRQTNLYDRFFRPAVQRAGLPDATTFHDLRHTYAALLISENANALSVMRRMGHSSVQVTFGVYGHIFPHLEEELTDRLDDLGRIASRRLQATETPMDASSDRDSPRRSGTGVAQAPGRRRRPRAPSRSPRR